jgi:hypothetical protein
MTIIDLRPGSELSATASRALRRAGLLDQLWVRGSPPARGVNCAVNYTGNDTPCWFAGLLVREQVRSTICVAAHLLPETAAMHACPDCQGRSKSDPRPAG